MVVTSIVPSLRNLDFEELKKLALSFGEKPYRAVQLAHWLYKKAAAEFREMSDLSKGLIAKLEAAYLANALRLVSKSVSEADRSVKGRPFGSPPARGMKPRAGTVPDTPAKAGASSTVKYVFRTLDEHFLETVLILQGSRRTLCLSTQIGCKMGCRFCASGKEGLIRHLLCGEILDQIAYVAKDQDKMPTNLVYMGMGEPLDNYEAVVKSIWMANAPWGFEIGQRRITVSTVGVIPGIKRLAEENLGQIKLSFSLHSPDPEMRTQLIPSGRKYRLPEILDALESVRDRFKRQMTMEYILIEGVTDREADAKKLVEISRSLKAKVNLIPYNQIEGVDFRRPSEERIRSFQKKLESTGISTTVRYSAGQDIDAACGQLRLLEERRSRARAS